MASQSSGTAGSTGLPSVVDSVIPGPGSILDRNSVAAQDRLSALAGKPAARPVARLLHGNEWLGHPLHPVIIAVPIGAWVVSAWYDARSARSGDPHQEEVADGSLRVGVGSAVAAAVTGLAQYLDTSDHARRETAVHAALNNLALGLYAASWVARSRGRRSLGRRLAAAGLGVVSVSGYLGGDMAYRLGVGVHR